MKAGLGYDARNARFTPNIIISFPLLLYPTTNKNSNGSKILFPLRRGGFIVFYGIAFLTASFHLFHYPLG